LKEIGFFLIKNDRKHTEKRKCAFDKEYYMNLFFYCYVDRYSKHNPMYMFRYHNYLYSHHADQFSCSHLNACLSHPCNKLDYTANNSCISNGIFSSSFSCKCINDNFEWSNEIKKCIPLNKCKYKTFGDKHPCGGIGRSISCQLTNHNRFECKCKSGWMGNDCKTPYNKCLISIKSLKFKIFKI
jgi:hypothetical protein